jgi:Zn-dependent protease
VGSFLLPVVIHELSHLVMMGALGEFPDQVSCSPVGISIQKPNTLPWKEGLILVAGSGCNFLLFFLFGLLYENNPDRLYHLALPHLAVGLFNLLPLSVTDGGRLLDLFLEGRCSFSTCRLVKQILALFSLSFLLFLSLAQLFATGPSFSLFLTLGYLLFLLFFPGE